VLFSEGGTARFLRVDDDPLTDDALATEYSLLRFCFVYSNDKYTPPDREIGDLRAALNKQVNSRCYRSPFMPQQLRLVAERATACAAASFNLSQREQL